MTIKASSLLSLAATSVLPYVAFVSSLLLSAQPSKWHQFFANMTEILCQNSTETFVSNITLCAILAMSNPLNNIACYKSSRCVMASLFMPPEGNEEDNQGFSCWSSRTCLYGDQLLQEGEVLPVPDICNGTRNLVCSRLGMVYADAPPRREACTAPFETHSFGCMHLANDPIAGYCNGRAYCEDLGSQLASPATHEDVMAMTAHFTRLYQGKHIILLGLRKLRNVWRWPSNLRDPGAFGTGDWHEQQPDPSGSVGMMWDHDPGEYSVGDFFAVSSYRPLCHVWNIRTSRCN